MHTVPFFIFICFEAAKAANAQSSYRNIAYFVSWSIYARNYTVDMIPASHLTHINYAFAAVDPTSGTVYSNDTTADTLNSGQLNLLKKSNRHLNLMLSIGGWTGSANLSKGVDTAAKRHEFARSSTALMGKLGFDGLDIDWELDVRGNDLSELLHDCRSALNEYGHKNNQSYRFLLSIASSAAPIDYNSIPLKRISDCVDHINLMGYDYATSESSLSAHHANLYPSLKNPLTTPFSTHRAVKDYLKAEVHPSKLVLGIPLYGRGFDSTDGLGKPFEKQMAGDYDEEGIWDYKSLPLAATDVEVDKQLAAAYSYNPDSRSLVSFDTEETVAIKAHYVKDMKLGGTMFWQCSADKVGQNSLIVKAESVLQLKKSSGVLFI